ncbi:hypothetical protein [Mycobacteroides abscessus]|uniref:hypothetical protein n=1 Tax=Mycobacteroides abscessus TaxID=36809 RepID=UPI000928269B|nr:hypothetical protein [Mycobacteroides abscessus]MBN7296648.1 hypothetical protein [Mycobacteroides abscessus subsp. abscessus]SHR97425.1 Uncharacterised protein [Mycobacteroides abscessus subsp. abscessus]
MTENLIEIEKSWDERDLPRVDRASVTLSAWNSDEEIAAMAAAHVSTYGNRYELDTILRLFRSDLRRAAMDAAKSRSRK